MHVLVPGGGGFVGAHLCAHLRSMDHRVTATDIRWPERRAALLEGVTFHEAAVDDRPAMMRLVAESAPDIIIHLAYVVGDASEQQPHLSARVNTLGFINCLDAALAAGVGRVIYASSIGVYGPSQAFYGDRPLTEDDECPLSCQATTYGALKALNEFTARKYADLFGLSTCGLRLSVVFGPGREHGFTTWTSDIAARPAAGQPVSIPLRADQKTSLISVSDVSRLLARTAEWPFQGAVILNSGGHTLSCRAIADIVQRTIPGADIRFDETAPDQPFVHDIDNTRIRRTLNFQLEDFQKSLFGV